MFERGVVVTGAASGIRQAVALRLAAPGTAQGLATRANTEGLAATAEAKGAPVATLTVDLCEALALDRPVALGDNAFGRIDQLVSNAGHADRRPFGVFTVGELHAQLSPHGLVSARLANAALADLQTSARGRVGANGIGFPTTTAAAKAALEALARSLGIRLVPVGTTVNVVVPAIPRGRVRTIS